MTDLLVRFKQLRKEFLCEAIFHLVDVQSRATLRSKQLQFLSNLAAMISRARSMELQL
jgi:hypothetical protein